MACEGAQTYAPVVALERQRSNQHSVYPTTLEPFRLPVVASDGHTYELQCLVEMMREQSPRKPLRSPLTREVLKSWVFCNRNLFSYTDGVV